MVKVILPGVKGKEAYRHVLFKVRELRKKYSIEFNREALDEFEAIYGVLDALDTIISKGKSKRKKKNAVDLEEIKRAVETAI